MYSRWIKTCFTIASGWVRILLVLCLPVATPCSAQQWNNPGSGNWFFAGNWNPTTVPNSTLAAQINNGGTAIADGGGTVQAFSVDAGKNGGTGNIAWNNVNVALQSSLDVAYVDSVFATGPINVISSGSATITNATSVNIGLGGTGDLNIGQTSAGSGAIAAGSGSLTLASVGSVTVAGDLDLGQTSGNGQATGFGEATVSGITSIFSIGGDLDIGQTSAISGGISSGTGSLNAGGINELRIGSDMDVAQSTGDGVSTANATVELNQINLLSIGDSLDVAKIRAIGSASNSGIGNFALNGSDVSIGFAATSPGSIEIARVLTSETARGVGLGVVTFTDANIDVANDVIVGELALGSTNGQNLANATLNLIDSKLDTRDLSIANRFQNTVGSVSGLLDVRRSLVVVQSLFEMSADATLRLHLDGSTRATGDGLPTDYSAIDADMATLDGTLEIIRQPDYLGPLTRGDRDTLQLITTLFGLTGSFDEVLLDATPLVGATTYIGSTPNGLDGLFASIDASSIELTLNHYLAIPGDANGDGLVDVVDFDIWNNHRFTAGTDWSSADFNGDGITDVSDFHIWNEFKFTSAAATSVPETTPMGGVLLAMSLLIAIARPRRPSAHNEGHRLTTRPDKTRPDKTHTLA